MRRELADDLRAQIAAAELAPGAQQPRRPRLAEHYDVSGMPIDRVVRELKDDGLIETVPGLEMFVKEG